MNLFQKRSLRIFLASFGAVNALAQLVTEVEVRNGDQIQRFDLSHQGPTFDSASDPKWAYIFLPGGLTPVGCSQNGVVLLKDAANYYRWSNGQLSTLVANNNTYGQQWVNPDNGRTYGSNGIAGLEAINANGDIAIGWQWTSAWNTYTGVYPNTTKTRTYGTMDVTQIWRKNDIIPRQINPDRFQYQYWDYDQWRAFDDRVGRLIKLDDSGALWMNNGVGVYQNATLYKSLQRIGNDGSVTTYYAPFTYSSYVKVSSGGVPYGVVPGLGFYVGETPVSYQPIWMNINGWILGSGKTIFKPDGAQEPSPDATVTGEYDSVTWIDEQNNPRGTYYNGLLRKAVWTRRKDSLGNILNPVEYTRHDYIGLRPPSPWATTHEVAPMEKLAQLGLASATIAGTTQTLPFLAVPAAISVDADRDGVVSSDLADVSTKAKPFSFWINDDIDRLHSFADSAADTMADITETEEDDIGPEEAQSKLVSADCWTNNKADSQRDLEDFARLQIYTSGLSDSFKNGQLFLGLKWVDVTGEPAIRVYRQLDATGSLRYLTDEAEATSQIAEYAIRDARYQSDGDSTSLHAMVHGTDTFILPTSLFANLSETNPHTHLLFEGVKAGIGQLKLVILKQESGNYLEIGKGPGVWMDLKKIGDMYEHWSVGNNAGGAPLSGASRIASESGGGSLFSYSASSPEEQQYILFVHGWNMEKWEKERFAETAYKRLWWQGYKGRFGLFSWPTTNRFDETITWRKAIEGISDGTNFDRGEWTAWRTGAPLRQLMQTLSSNHGGNLYVFSHSMGGIPVSEALRLQSEAGGGQIARVYVASQAALSVHMYDGTLSAASGSANAVQWTYAHPNFKDGNGPFPAVSYGPDTPNIYQGWCANVLQGGNGASSVVGALVNFYNQNDYALAAPIWQFNQITKPDWRDILNGQPYLYEYDSLVAQFGRINALNSRTFLDRGTRADPKDRYEIMAFAAESPVKALGSTDILTQGVTRSIPLRSIWPVDGGDHKAHTWHSGQFRSNIQKQKGYWEALLGQPGFQIPTTTLP